MRRGVETCRGGQLQVSYLFESDSETNHQFVKTAPIKPLLCVSQRYYTNKLYLCEVFSERGVGRKDRAHRSRPDNLVVEWRPQPPQRQLNWRQARLG